MEHFEPLRSLVANVRIRWGMTMLLYAKTPDVTIVRGSRVLPVVIGAQPWPIPEFTREFTLGTIYSLRGDAYLKLRQRDPRTLDRLAIADLEAAAALLGPAADPRWPHLLNMLSVAYAQRLDGEPRQNLERAIALGETALAAIDREKSRQQWVDTLFNLTGHYDARQQVVGDNGVPRSLELLQDAHAFISREHEPAQWALITISLGHTLMLRDARAGEDIEQAIDLIESAVPLLPRAADPVQWAAAVLLLSSCYRRRVKGDAVRNWTRALAANTQALEALDPVQTPDGWAHAQRDRGILFANRIDGDAAENLRGATRAFEAAATVFDPRTHPHDYAVLQMNLSQLRQSTTSGPVRDLKEEAVDHARRAVAQVSSDTPALYAEAHLRLGNALRVRTAGDPRQNLADAVASFETALKMLDRNVDPGRWSFAAISLANVLAERVSDDPIGDLERSIALAQEGIACIDPAGAPTAWANALRNLSISFSERVIGSRADNIERAIALAELALVVVSAEDHPSDRSRVLETLGDGFRHRIRGDRLDNLERAIQAYDLAGLARDKDDDPEGWLRIGHRRRRAFMSLHSQLEQAPQSATRDRIALRRSDVTIVSRQQYLEELRETAAVVNADDHPRAWAMASQDIADGLFVGGDGSGDFQTFHATQKAGLLESIRLYESMLTVNRRDSRPREWAATRALTAKNYLLLHLLEDLWHRGPSGLADRARPDLPNRSSEAMRYLDLAAAAWEDALGVQTIDRDPREHLTSAVKLADVHIGRRDWDAAAAAFSMAGAAAQRLLADVESCESEVHDTLRALGELSAQAPFVEVMRGRLDRALEVLEVGRARLLLKALTLASLPLPAEERTELDSLFAGIARCERRLISDQLVDRTTPLDEAIALRARVRDIVSRLDPAVVTPPVDPSRLLSEVTATGEVVVVPLLTSAGGCICLGHARGGGAPALEVVETESVVTLDGLFKGRVAAGRESWQEAYQAFADDGDFGRWNEIVQAATASLGPYVTSPLLSALNAVGIASGRLDILPQGALGLLPIGIAPDPRTGQALIDRFDISLNPSLTVLAHVRGRRDAKEPPRHFAAVRLADGGDRPLPYTAIETSLLQSWFPESAGVTVDAATHSTEDALSALNDRDLWHFACHGEFNVDAPLDSGLGPFADGLLTLRKLFEMRGHRPPRLVVLSACGTALYDTRELPSEFIGLPVAFLQLGAASVIATLWPVGDISTALLMGRFYEEYLEQGRASCEALRGAQLWLRDARTVDLRHTIEVWAGEGRLRDDDLRKLRAFVRRRSPEARPFAAPAFWAGFVHYGA